MESEDDLVPQLASHNITFSDLQIATHVVQAIASLPLTEYQDSNLRPFRKALASCMELHRKTYFKGKPEQEHYEQRQEMRSLKRQKVTETKLQQAYIATSKLRQGRIQKLKELQSDGREEEIAKNMIPDGYTPTTVLLLELGVDHEPTKTLPKLRSCYVCKQRFRDLHHFYDQLCPECASLNWQKRHQTADCTNKIAVITGARVKIGLQTCLKLLRANGTVVATTRFPNAAVAVYRQEADFSQFQHRLHIYGLDLRDVTGLEAFTRFLKLQYPNGIDILINNACQTIRRPTQYYRSIVEQEQELWEHADETHRTILSGCIAYERIRRQLDRVHSAPSLPSSSNPKAIRDTVVEKTVEDEDLKLLPDLKSPAALVVANKVASDSGALNTNAQSIQAPFERTGLSHSAAMSQMLLLPEDAGVSDEVLPPGVTDVNGQQIDLRTTNSWLLKMDQVSTPEVLECMFVNSIAPFILNSRLQPLMAVPGDHSDRYIINVSAMEGKFYRYKMPNHPHTNMAKAALNMLTRTSADDLAEKHRIYMNSVDTGWINDENPLERAARTASQNHFQTPIDEIDAAARILDPVFSGINRESPVYGKFLKDYRESEW